MLYVFANDVRQLPVTVLGLAMWRIRKPKLSIITELQRKQNSSI